MTETPERIQARATALGDNEEQFRDRLFALRRAHGLTQQQVAERMGVSQSVVTRLEGYDSNPTLSTLRRYALAVEARLRFDAVSDRPYAHPVAESLPTVRVEPGVTTPDVEWAASRVTTHA